MAMMAVISAARRGHNFAGAGGLAMWTTGLVYLIVFMGFMTFGCGAVGLWFLLVAEVAPLRYYAMVDTMRW
jgi:hypothetical protein